MRNVILARLGRLFEITGSPPVGNVGDAYSVTFGTVGGIGTITWTCSDLGTSGATFSAGTLSSAALANGGAFPFTLTATDANRQVATADFILIVLGAQAFVMCLEGSSDPMVIESTQTEMSLQ